MREYIYVGQRLLVSIGPAASPTITATATPTVTSPPTPTVTPTPVPAGTVLLLVGVTSPLASDDQAIATRLTQMGFVVSAVYAGSVTSADANGKVLVVMGTTVSPSVVDPNFEWVSKPLLVSKAALFPIMGLTGGAVNSNYGTAAGQTQVSIVNASSPLAAGFTGTVTVTSAATSYVWGRPTTGGVVVATLADGSGQPAIFSYETNSAIVGGTAPARRVGFFFGDGAASNANAAGGRLFDAAVRWLAGLPPPTPTVPPRPTATYTFTPTVDATATTPPRPTATVTPVPKGNVLFLMGSTSPMGTGDTAVRDHLVAAGYTVTPIYACTAGASNANGKVLVIVGGTVPVSTCGPGVGTAFQNVAVPALVSKAGMFANMLMTGPANGSNWGSSATNQSQTTIITAASPLAAGLSGTVAVESPPVPFAWGSPNANATIAASIVGASGQATVFGYAKGAQMPGGPAAACRVGAFWTDDDPAAFNANGWKLFDAAVTWLTAASCR